MKQVEVQIMGQGYLLGCPDGGELQLRAAVSKVDAAMCKIRDGGKVKARDRIAVLAALNLAFDAPETPVESGLDTHIGNAATPAALAASAQGMAQEMAHAAAEVGGAAPSAALAAMSAVPADTDARIAALVARLDKALGSDGQLL